MVSGFLSYGANVKLLGVMPTPAVAYLTRRFKADASVVISASHNTYEFNGVKYFSNKGMKIPDEIEEEIWFLNFDTVYRNIPVPDSIIDFLIRKNNGILLIEEIKSKVSTIDSIIGEENNITVEAYVFGTEIFESNKSNFKILNT